MALMMTVYPTGRFETIEGVRCRIWRGETCGKGTLVEMYVPCVRTLRTSDQSELEAELRAVKAELQAVAYDIRLFID